jgi:2-dehydropantoate 2-reductase
MNLKYAVIGTGAIGGFYGGMLARAGKEVHFLFNTDYDHVKLNGLKVDSVTGDFHLSNVLAYNNTKDMSPCDIILVGLKSTNNHLLKTLLVPLIKPDTLVILIQNGLELEADLAKDFPNLNIAGGLGFICSNKIGPGHIAHLDFGKLTVGVYQNNNPEMLRWVCEDFNQAGVPTDIASDLSVARWKKLVWNIPFNGMTVVLNTTTDQLMQNADSQALIYDLMLEVIQGASHCGVQISENFAKKMIEMTLSMTPYAPSMKLDYDHHRELETGYIYTRPTEAALAAGFDMRKVKMLEQQLRFIQQTYM